MERQNLLGGPPAIYLPADEDAAAALSAGEPPRPQQRERLPRRPRPGLLRSPLPPRRVFGKWDLDDGLGKLKDQLDLLL